MQREHFSSRLGFILISAGCAIGLGNIWRFPYITGVYGGATFVLIYLLFLVIMGLPVVVMEMAVGRASQRSTAKCFNVLEPVGTKWHWFKYFSIAGNYLLMMFYTTISGWLLYYFYFMLTGQFEGMNSTQIEGVFGALTANPGLQIVCMLLIVGVCFYICSIGLEKGVERVTKIMMTLLLVLLVILAVRSVTLPGAGTGLDFYLKPNLDAVHEHGLATVIFAAMGQAFFTLSIGVGAISVFGSRADKNSSLTEDALWMVGLDTAVALMAGLIIFPACFSYDVAVGSGPSLLFITMPNIFNAMDGGRVWGSLFFLFMLFAAASTVIGVFEFMITFVCDNSGMSRKKSVLINMVLVALLSLPCIFGFNIWSGFTPLGPGSNVLDLEDFLVSNNILPLGSLVFVFFCVLKIGWGWNNFIHEADLGGGLLFPNTRPVRLYLTYVLPALILYIFVMGYVA